MTAATRKASERARRKERGEVEYKGWLSASDHAALTQMARDSGMTQAQVASRLIGLPAAIKDARELIRLKVANAALEYAPIDRSEKFSERVKHLGIISDDASDQIHSDLTAAVGLSK